MGNTFQSFSLDARAIDFWDIAVVPAAHASTRSTA